MCGAQHLGSVAAAIDVAVDNGFILDIDGTIWDSTNIVSRAWNRAARDSGSLRKETITANLLKTQFGKPMDEIADFVFPEDTPEMKKRIMELCCAYEHEELYKDPCRIDYPGVVDTVREMSGHFPFFIVSNCQKGYIELVCEKLGITGFISDSECFGNTGKGKADNIADLVKRNGLKYPVYIGDTDGDRIACEKAGVPFIFAEYGFGETKETLTAATVSSFDEIRALFC